MTIMLTQYFCTLRHIAYGVAWDDREHTTTSIEEAGRDIISSGVINGRCGIDGGPIHPEHVPTTWLTMEIATAALAEGTIRQAALRRTLEDAGMTLEEVAPMTIIQSCDHHDEHGSVPDNRSRARMLQQLVAAMDLADKIRDLSRMGMVIHLTAPGDRREEPEVLLRPTLEVDLDAFMTLWNSYWTWINRYQPQGDDLAPAVSPPAEIRVPPDTGEPRTGVRE